jgi:hypothetical protein
MICFRQAVLAVPPQLYHQSTQESPTRGDPDDLLLLAGFGFAADDTVVYRALSTTTEPLIPPAALPKTSGASFGTADIVSTDLPYSITVRLPQSMRSGQSYALWVRTARREWSEAVMINDARPLWVSPAYVYASGMPGGLPREIKVVGRNLQPSPGQSTRIRLVGAREAALTIVSKGGDSRTLTGYVARAPLPEHMAPGNYQIQVSRDGVSWVNLSGQRLEVRPDPSAGTEFSVADARFGNCHPDDGADDTPCIIRAVAAAERAGGGVVHFGPGTWDLVDGSQPGMSGTEGIFVPAGVQLRGAGDGVTKLQRHAQWNVRAPTAAFTLAGHTLVSGFTFKDLQTYQTDDPSGPFLQLGKGWRVIAPGSVPPGSQVEDVIITRNIFDKPKIAIGVGGLPIAGLFLTYNTFGAYQSALELSGDQHNTSNQYRLDDSVIDYNLFKPGSQLDLVQKSGSLASEIGAGLRDDFSGNTADGSSTDFLYSPLDARGWRAAFFWSPINNVEDVLISQNVATCTGDKIGDGEAIAFDNNVNAFAFANSPTVVDASHDGVTVAAPFLARQYDVDVPAAHYYVGEWVQIVSGRGLGQVRKIVGYETDTSGHRTVIRVAPDWDVMPSAGSTRISVGREYWQVFVIANHVDNRAPLCQKSNRSRKAAGVIGLWAQTADSVVAGNDQHDSDGILVQQDYAFQHLNTPSPTPCPDCSEMGFFNYFLEIRENVIDGEYDWSNDCSHSGIEIGVGAAPGGITPPPTVGFGVSVSHNTVGHADAMYGGGIAQINTAWTGPEPHRWPLSDNVLIYHNSIVNIDGPRALAICGASHPRVGIAFPTPAIAWRTVLYANSCRNVTTPIGDGGVNTTRVCPSSVTDSCECPTSGK